MRWMLAVAAVFVLAGCGSGVSGHAGGAPITPDHAAPPIVAANETPPDDIQWFLKMNFNPDSPSSSDTSTGTPNADLFCMQLGQSGSTATSTTDCPQPSPDDAAAEQQYTQAIQPAPDSEPLVVAKLELGGGQELFFTEWTTSTGAACWEVDEEGPDGGGGGGPSGPCAQARLQLAYPDQTSRLSDEMPVCDSLCLDSDSSGGDPATQDYRLEGTVPADAEALRVTVAGGGTATYPLVGPRLSDPSLRVFMVDLGAQDWRKLELVRQGSVAATVTAPPFQVAWEECDLQVGPMPTPTLDPSLSGDDNGKALEAQLAPYNDALDTCLSARGFG